MQQLHHPHPFTTESGYTFPEIDIAYSTYGELNEQRNNVIWVCHALTANADAADWWDGLIGVGKLFDPTRYYIVCANMLGSCYGTTSPISIHPETGKKYGKDFPVVTVRDMVRVHQILREALGIKEINLLGGGSMGGQQALEWAIIEPDLFKRVAVIAANAKHSAWGIAFNESQRMALEADATLYTDEPNAGQKGLEAARAMAMLSYRHYQTYESTQTDNDGRFDDFRASSYQRYQGYKLWKRFDPISYWILGKAMDSHDVGRDRGGVVEALKLVKAPTAVIGIQSDILFPIEEQKLIAQHIPEAQIEIIHSRYGHDGFLIEYDQLTKVLDHLLDIGVGEEPVLSQLSPEVPGTELF